MRDRCGNLGLGYAGGADVRMRSRVLIFRVSVCRSPRSDKFRTPYIFCASVVFCFVAGRTTTGTSFFSLSLSLSVSAPFFPHAFQTPSLTASLGRETVFSPVSVGFESTVFESVFWVDNHRVFYVLFFFSKKIREKRSTSVIVFGTDLRTRFRTQHDLISSEMADR